jgi:2-(1,2-epoxy-1,2-dihydrophenyl)acetyl-CoA isomerase
MSETKLLTDSRDGVLTLTLNRPEKLNAIDNELSRSLLQALEAGAVDEDVRVIRLRGNGRAFCAGRDVSTSPTEDDLVLVQAVAKSIVRNPKLVLAEVHGWTVGAGFEWMLDADVVVAAESTRFKLPEASLGVFVTGGLSATLGATIGLARAKALTLFGEVFTADQALAWGLVWKVVGDSGLEEASWNAAVELATLRPLVAAQFKRVFNLLGLATFDRAVEEENRAQRVLGPQ